MNKFTGTLLALAAVPVAVAAVPSVAQSSLAMLDTLDRGGWEVRYRDGSTPRKICLRNGREFIQLRHTQASCKRFVVEDGRSQVTVQYTCAGDGYGRTNIRKESGSLVQIESQGIENGRPFQFTAEARRTGRCN